MLKGISPSTWIDSKTLPVWLVLPLLVTSRDVQEAASSFGTTPRSVSFKSAAGSLLYCKVVYDVFRAELRHRYKSAADLGRFKAKHLTER